MRDEGHEYVFLGVGPVAEVEHEAFFLAVGGVFGAEAGIRIRNVHAAAASVGSALLTMGRDRIGNGDGCLGLRVHGSSFRR